MNTPNDTAAASREDPSLTNHADRPGRPGAIPAPLAPAANEPLTVAPKRRLLEKVHGVAWTIFRESPPFPGKLTPTYKWERSTNGALLALAQEAADRHGLHVDECAQAFTRGCEETVRYASELTAAALEAMTATLNDARPTTIADVRITSADDLRAHVLEQAREATTPALVADCVEQVAAEQRAVSLALDLCERNERIVARMDQLLADDGHSQAYRAIFRLVREIAGGGR